MAEPIHDALILGAGPAGATAALLLARAGWRVAIVEKSRFPRRKVCGEFLSVTSLPLLHALGLADAFLAKAGPAVRRAGLYETDSDLAASMPRAGGPDGAGHALGREHLDGMLLAAAIAAGATCWQPWRAVALDRAGENWRCAIEGPEGTRALVARRIIAATGSWERSPLFDPLAIPHRDGDLLGFKAHFSNCSLPDDLMPLLVFPGGYGGMVHSDAGRVSLSCCIRRDTLRGLREQTPGRAGDVCAGPCFRSVQGGRAGPGKGPIAGNGSGGGSDPPRSPHLFQEWHLRHWQQRR